MLIYRCPKTRAWMMTRDGVNHFEWIDEKWQPHRDSPSPAGDTPPAPPGPDTACAERASPACTPAPQHGAGNSSPKRDNQ